MTDAISARRAYDAWAIDYDSDENATRDLDAAVLRDADLPVLDASVIEIGAGTGKNTAYLAAHARSVLALDFSPAMLERARQRCTHPGVSFVEHDIREPWPVPSGAADLVIGNLVLEHIEQLAPVFAAAFRALRSGGLLYSCELHPYRQLQGATARYRTDSGEQRVEAYVHLTSDYVHAALGFGFQLSSMSEPRDAGAPPSALPRLLQLVFRKP